MRHIVVLLSLVTAISFGTVVAPSAYTGKGSSSPLTAKGDLYTRSSTADAALAIGTDGLVLVADSSTATGMAWTSVAGTGDVVGPASAIDRRICVFDGVTGKAIADNGTVVVDSGGDLVVRNDQDALSRVQIRNDDTGSSAAAQLKLSSALGDVTFTANSSAAGATADLTADSNFSSGLRLSILGNNPLLFRVNGIDTLTFNVGTAQQAQFYGSVRIGTTSGADNGVLSLFSSLAAGGGGADPYIAFHGSSTEMARLGYFAGTDDFYIRNYTATGKVYIYSNDTRAITVDASQNVAFDSLTASRVVVSDGSKNLASSTMTTTKLESLTGEQIDAMIETPSDKTYTLRGKARYAGTINKVFLKTSSGTITAKLQIAGVDVTSCTAISVSSTPSDTTCTAANAVAVGDAITLVTSSNSSSADLVVSVDVTR